MCLGTLTWALLFYTTSLWSRYHFALLTDKIIELRMSNMPKITLHFNIKGWYFEVFFNVHFLYCTHLSLRISPKLIVQRRKGVGIKQILGGTEKRSLFSFDSWGCIILSPQWNKPFLIVLSSCSLHLFQWHHALHHHIQTLGGHPQFSILSFTCQVQ